MAYNLTGESGSFTYSGSDAGVMTAAVFGSWSLSARREEYGSTPPAYLMKAHTLGVLQGTIVAQGFQDNSAAFPPMPNATSGTIGTFVGTIGTKTCTVKVRLVGLRTTSSSYSGAPITIEAHFILSASAASDTIVLA